MHAAYICNEVLSNLPTNIDISSIAVCSNNVVFVGTKSGHLVIYTITPCVEIAQNKGNPFKIDLTKSIRTFSKKPVLQMAAIDELQILISLTDCIQVHNIKSFVRRDDGTSQPETKDSKREAMPLVYTLQDSRMGTPPTFFSLNVRYSDGDKEELPNLRMCVLYKKVAQLHDWKQGEQKFSVIFNLPTLPDFMRASLLTRKYLFCGSRQQYYRISLKDGSEKPLSSVGNNMDSIVAKLGNEAIAVGHDNEVIPLSYEGDAIWSSGVKFSQTPTVIEYDEPYIVALTDSSVEVRPFMTDAPMVQKLEISAPVCVTKFQKVIWIATKKSLFRLYQVPTEQQITAVAHNKQFKLAELLAEKVPEPRDPQKKRTKINLIRTLDGLDKFNRREFQAAFVIFKQLRANPIHILGLYPDLISLSILQMFNYPVEISPIGKKELEGAIKVLVDYLQLTRKELVDKERKGVTTVQPSEYFALATTSGEIPSTFSVGSLREVIDTALLKCFVMNNDPELGNLLRLENNQCNYENTVKILEAKRKHKELVSFYQTRKKHVEALKLLKDLSGQQNSSMSGHEMSVSYLQKLGVDYLDVIFEYSKWVLRAFPNDGLQIFTDQSPECESLPPNRVVKFLKEISNKLAIQYLEHMVMKRGMKEKQFHNNLAQYYKDEMMNLYPAYRDSLTEGEEPAKAGHEPGDLGELRRKLIDFLTESEHYGAEDLLAVFPTELHIELAILNGRIGKHDRALEIYIHVLKDKKEAENYCKSIESKKLPNSNWQNVYLSLFSVYLNAKPTNAATMLQAPGPVKADVDSALKVLQDHWDMINMEKALKLLPEWVSLRRVSIFLENVLRKTTNQKRDDQILKNLLVFESMRFQRELDCHLQEKFDLLDEVCHHCRNKIGNSKFVRSALEMETGKDSKLYHLNCFKTHRDRVDAGRFY